MAGRVYLCTIAALVMATAHVRAFFLPPFVAPLVHPALIGGLPFLGAPFFGKGFNQQAPRSKPLSRPFTLADAQILGGNFGQFPGGGFVLGQPSDGLFGGDINGFGNDFNIIGGNTIGATNLGLAAATNDINSVTLTGAMDPLDVHSGLDISDSSVLIRNNGGLSYGTALGAGVGSEISDSTVLVKNTGGVGGLPGGSMVTAY